jgi:hypothetical protein
MGVDCSRYFPTSAHCSGHQFAICIYILTLISPFAVKALALTKHGKTPFPAQVPVKLLMDLGNMPEEEFLEILEYSAYCQCPHLFYLPCSCSCFRLILACLCFIVFPLLCNTEPETKHFKFNISASQTEAILKRLVAFQAKIRQRGQSPTKTSRFEK